MTPEERARWKRVMLWEESEEVQRSQARFISAVLVFVFASGTLVCLYHRNWSGLVSLGFFALSFALGVVVWSLTALVLVHAVLLCRRLWNRFHVRS